MGVDAAWEQVLRGKGLINDETPAEVQTPAPRRVSKPATQKRLKIDLWLPGLKTVSEANTGGKNSDKWARKKMQRDTVLAALPIAVPNLVLPTPVVMIRVGLKRLDDDNLESAFKAIRDAVANWLGVDDGDTSAVRWVCKQKAGYTSGVRIIIG